MLHCSEVAQSAPHSVFRGISGRWPCVRLCGLWAVFLALSYKRPTFMKIVLKEATSCSAIQVLSFLLVQSRASIASTQRNRSQVSIQLNWPLQSDWIQVRGGYAVRFPQGTVLLSRGPATINWRLIAATVCVEKPNLLTLEFRAGQFQNPGQAECNTLITCMTDAMASRQHSYQYVPSGCCLFLLVIFAVRCWAPWFLRCWRGVYSVNK